MDIITRTYENFEDARNVVARLEREGVATTRISLIGRQQTGDDGPAEGGAVGGVIGGAAGLLAGLGVIALPGIGPVVAAGWLASTLVGAGAGTLVGGALGALTEAGFSREDAARHAETLRRGGNFVSVQAEAAIAPRVRAIMDAAFPIDDGAGRRGGSSSARVEGEDRDLSGVVS